ncbi:hypothetical protein GLAREA_12428 [Glarea lozoyensis ATCC 20868]|nr:uncharacterized protein GLAREA_12428 [Glarea lozoyensis ATCC 20868]EPE31672.1 hypothetical protein GLAREA_12428 [Glarea lozoyensis ATCC 20868]
MSDISDHSDMMDFEEDDDRQIAPTRRGLPADTGSPEDWEDDSVMFGEVLNTIKKQPVVESPNANYRQYVPHLPHDEDYHKKVGTPADWFGTIAPGSVQRIDETKVMVWMPVEKIKETLRAAAIEKELKKRKDAEHPFLGLPMLFNITGRDPVDDPEYQHSDPYYEDPNGPLGHHKDPYRKDLVPVKKPEVPDSTTPGQAKTKAAKSKAPASALGNGDHFVNSPHGNSPPNPAKRKVSTYSKYNPNKKRAYTWKNGSAPKRRLGHVKYPPGHEFYEKPKKGEYHVVLEGEDEAGDVTTAAE